MSNNKIKKGILHVFIANFINLVISLFTGFVLPKFLSIETYANIKLFQLYISYIGVVSLGFADGMYLRLGGKEIKELDKKEIFDEFKTYKAFQVCVAIILIVISAIIKNEILIFCSLVIIPINIAGYLRNLYNAIGLFDKYSKFTNINTIMIFLINIVLLFIIKVDSYVYFIFSYIIIYFIYWMIIEYETKKIFGKTNSNIQIKYLIEDIKSGFLLLIGNFCNVIFTGIDRIFVQNLLGTIKFAYYSFAVSIENLMNVFIAPISTVMYNFFCNNKNSEVVIETKKYIMIFSMAVISAIFPAKFIINLWLLKYKESLSILTILFAAQYMSIMVRCIHVNLYKAYKKQNRYFYIMIFVVLFSMISNIIGYLLKKEMISIAIATLITNMLWLLIGEIEFREFRLKIKDYIYLLTGLVIFLLVNSIENSIVGFIVYCCCVLLITFIIERDTLKKVLNKISLYINKFFERKKNGRNYKT